VIIDLALYELGNVLLRGFGWSATDVSDQLDELVVISGTPLVMAPEWLRGAALLGADHGLTFYDAAWASSARALGIPLVSADQRLVSAGLAESPAAFAGRMGLC
jgi:predicted nucleic acid-binding protein